MRSFKDVGDLGHSMSDHVVAIGLSRGRGWGTGSAGVAAQGRSAGVAARPVPMQTRRDSVANLALQPWRDFMWEHPRP
jgi:hypothetical protein